MRFYELTLLVSVAAVVGILNFERCENTIKMSEQFFFVPL